MTLEQLFSWFIYFLELLNIKSILVSALTVFVILGVMFYVVDRLRG